MKMITNYLKKAAVWYRCKAAQIYCQLPNNGMIEY